jgi:hypothetical protein
LCTASSWIAATQGGIALACFETMPTALQSAHPCASTALEINPIAWRA